MAETKTKAAPQKKPEAPPETEKVGEHTLIHKGHGRFTIEGDKKEFPNRDSALAYIAEVKAAAEYQEQFGDTVPEGIDIHHRTLEYRGTLLELPMNEQYLPEGGYSPYYDRAWVWGWGRATGSDVSMKQAKGYRVVTRDELEKAVDEGQVPEHYRSLLMSVDHGNRMQYGDLVLMRIPRVLWRQQRAAKREAAIRRIKNLDAEQSELFEKAGVKNTSGPIQNEISAGLKVTGM